MNMQFTLGLRAVVASLLLLAPPILLAQTQTLHNHVPAVVSRLRPIGRLPGTTNLRLAIGLPLRNQTTLSNLLQQIYDPTSANYHHYLTPEEFTARFGPTELDYRAVSRFAQTHGLKVTGTQPNRLLLDVTGTASDIEKAFHVAMQVYQHPTENRTFYAPDMQPSLDLSVPVLDISGLNNYSLPRPRLQVTPLANRKTNASPNTGSGIGGTYMGKDFRAAYVPGVTLNGSGQAVGLLQFDGYTASDITYYENLAGLPNVPLRKVLLDGFDGSPTGNGGEVEVSLDIETTISMAPNLSQVIVYEAGQGGSWHDILNRMATDNLAKQLSCSWYIPEGSDDPVADQIFQQMAAQGQSFLNASGDDDAWTGLISFPGDSPYITQVGGTTLTTTGPGGSRISETVWNWYNGSGSGGGISTQYPIPSWQTTVNMTVNQGSAAWRNVPDVALTANNVYVRVDGLDENVGGTSCAAPLWAGFTALVNQQAAASGHSSVGFLNPAIYAIGAGSSYSSAFYDITTGNNESPASPTQFSAVPGYDLCTGWGTPNGQSLINALANPEALVINPATGFASFGGVGGPFTMTAQSLSLTNSGTNSLNWILVSSSPWLNASPAGGTLTPGGPVTTVTASLNSAASNLLVGAYSATLLFTNQSDNVGQSRQFTLTIVNPPAITLQPTNQAVFDGATATFAMQAVGGLPLSYQWQSNGTNLTDGGNIAGSATPNLTISNASFGNVGTYSVIVTNAAAAITSSNALLAIIPSAPVITLQPTDQTVTVNGTAGFTVSALGTKPFSYQWTFNGTNINGATNNPLRLTDVQFSQAGTYNVVLTNINGSIQSSNASLTVIPCDPAPANLVSWWRAEGDANDAVGTNNGTPIGNLDYTNGEVGLAFIFDGSTSYIPIPASPSLDIGASGSGVTIECWVKPSAFNIAASGPIIEWDSSSTDGLEFWTGQTLFGNVIDTSGNANRIESATGLLSTNNWQHVALTYDKYSGNAFIYLNGTQVATNNFGSITPQTTYPVNIGRRTGQPVGLNDTYGGLMDELSIYNRALSQSEIQAIYDAGIAGKCVPLFPPMIITQPAAETNYVGQASNFSVAVTGTSPLGYQWSFNSNSIAGATNATLTLTNLQLSQSGNYAVLVTNLCGSTNSIAAVLMVNPMPPCDPPPARLVSWWRAEGNANDSAGTNNGTPMGNLGYTNGKVGLAFAFDGSTSYIPLPASPSLDIGGSGSGITIECWVNPNNPPVGAMPIIEWDSVSSCALQLWEVDNQTLFANVIDTSGNSHVIASTNGAITTTNWQHVALTYDKSSGATYLYINGSIAATNNFGSITPQTTFPVNIGRRTGEPVGLNDTYSGLMDELSIYNRALSQTEIQAIYNAGGAGKCVPLFPPTITIQPTNQTALVGATASFSVNATGTQPLSYQWSFNSNSIAAATNATLILPGVQLNQAGSYSVLVTNLYGSTNSAVAALTVLSPATIVTQPTNQTVYIGGTTSFGVTASGTSPLSYQWNFNQASIANATNALLVLTNVQLGQAGNYTVLASNLANSVLSSNAVLAVKPTPALGAAPSGNSLFLFWPANTANFVLEVSPTMAPANWVQVATTPLLLGNQYLITVPVSPTNCFYRLRYTNP